MTLPDLGSGTQLAALEIGLPLLWHGSPILLLLPLRAVLRAALIALLHAARVEGAADDVVAHARQILHAAAADQHDRVLLQVVSLAGDVAVTSMLFVSRTRATLRSAEFGFFGVVV